MLRVKDMMEHHVDDDPLQHLSQTAASEHNVFTPADAMPKLGQYTCIRFQRSRKHSSMAFYIAARGTCPYTHYPCTSHILAPRDKPYRTPFHHTKLHIR